MGIILVCIVVKNLSYQEIVSGISSIGAKYWAYALALSAATYASMAIRWWQIINRRGLEDFRKYFSGYLRASFFNFFTPASLGSDVYRVVDLKKDGIKDSVIAKALIKERCLGIYAHLVYLCLATIFVWDVIGTNAPPATNIAILLVCTVILIIGLAAKNIKVCRLHMVNSYIAQLPLRIRRRVLFLESLNISDFALPLDWDLQITTAIGVVTWTLAIYTLSISVDLGLSYREIVVASIITEFSRLIPISAQGIGVREAAFLYAAGWFGGNAEKSYVIAMVYYGIHSIILCVNGLLGMVIEKKNSMSDRLSIKEPQTTKYKGISAFYFNKILRAVIHMANLNTTDLKALDYGCGNGQLKKLSKNKNIIGYDIHEGYSEIKDWSKVNFQIFIAVEVLCVMRKEEIESVLNKLREKQGLQTLVIATSRLTWINKLGMKVLRRREAHDLVITEPKLERKILSKYCHLIDEKSVFGLCDIRKYEMKEE